MGHNSDDPRVSRYLDSWTKRCFDLLVCLLLLTPAIAIMGCAALAILLREGRPVLFLQDRVGRHGRLFRMPKLRTLRVDSEPYRSKTEYDLRSYVTSTGRMLRRHKLDELPQLFTVLTGRMSLVGPRPELPGIVATYNAFHRKRLLMKPGATGLWQVLANHTMPIHRNLKYDLYYLRHASLRLDIKLVFLTLGYVLKPPRGRP